MSLKRKIDMDRIVEIVSYLKSQVELSNPNNFTDINIYSENFYRDFLNLLYGYNLSNINVLNQNAAAIDLGDEVQKIAIQVTSSSDLAKAKKTIKSFNDHNLHEKYDRVVVLNITLKKNHKKQTLGQADKLQLETGEDIWDTTDLIKHISDKSAADIAEIRTFLENQVHLGNHESVPKEIVTFQDLIELLSDEGHPNAGAGFIDEPDPKGKIEDRFSDHAEFLKSEFMALYSEFGEVLSDVRNHVDLGQVKLRRLSLHLKVYSDSVLSKCGGDAKLALEQLVADFEARLKKNGTAYDVTAIRFFLVDELTRCNVFPNKEAISA